MGIGAAIAGVSAVASVGSSLLSSGASSSAADTQAAAANNAAALQQQQYLQTRSDLAPYRDTGAAAFNRLGEIFGLNGPAPAPAPSSSASSGFTVPSDPNGGIPSGIIPDGYSLVGLTTGPDGGQSQWGIRNDQNGVIYSQATSQGDLLIPGGGGATLADALASRGSFGGDGGGGGGGAAAASAGGAAGNPLAAYGISGLTYNPADYGLGNGVFDPSQYGLGNGTFQPTEAQLESMPGYQFTRDQGLKSVQNSATARGQGVSGAALKGAAAYATGLADNTVQTEANIFNNNLANAQGIYGGNVQRTQGLFQQNLSNVINPLFQYAGLGENAATQTGQIGSSIINSQSNLITGAANAQAAGTVGSANAISSGLNSAGQAPLNYMLYNQLANGGGGNYSGTGGASDTTPIVY